MGSRPTNGVPLRRVAPSAAMLQLDRNASGYHKSAATIRATASARSSESTARSLMHGRGRDSQGAHMQGGRGNPQQAKAPTRSTPVPGSPAARSKQHASPCFLLIAIECSRVSPMQRCCLRARLRGPRTRAAEPAERARSAVTQLQLTGATRQPIPTSPTRSIPRD